MEDFTSTLVSEDEILDAAQRVEGSDRDVLIRLCWNLRLNPEIARYTTGEAKKQHAQSVVEDIGVDRVESVLDEAFPEKEISAYDLLTALLDADLERLQGGEKAE